MNEPPAVATVAVAASETATAAPAQPSAPSHRLFRVDRSWKVGAVVGVVMILLALVGVGLTMANRSAASAYWISLVPLYGLLCIWLTHYHGHASVRADSYWIWRQVFHWAAIDAAICLDFFIGSTSLVTTEGVGIDALVLLALGCFLAGVHFEWLFLVVGVLLTLTLVAVIEAEHYLWLLVGVGVVALIVMVLLNRYLRPAPMPVPTVTVIGSPGGGTVPVAEHPSRTSP
jgi:hypothetical protein